ncbi:RNA polymerase sigma factor [Paenibacillus lentus]|uniref:RNA polymerase sigma factor n=1 Tax=Paenibacillus lentus TaxID=1338368 RepID=UPI001FE61BDA|nr:sigma-70 family RNA polymerase sigma factor [Paenibacillus lentus]
MDPDIQHVIFKVIQGDLTQFEQIMNKYQRKIFSYCYHMLGHYAEAEDAAQDTFIKAYKNLEKYQPDKSFEVWLYTIASNTCIDALRKRKSTKYLPFLYQNDKDNRHVDQTINDHYYNEEILISLSRLTIEERSLLILRCV